VEPREFEDFEVVITSLTRPRLLDELFLLENEVKGIRVNGRPNRGIRLGVSKGVEDGCIGGRPQGIERLGMADCSDTLGSPWLPLVV
jgi:hypothetical protein